jgi:peptide chain release factor 3
MDLYDKLTEGAELLEELILPPLDMDRVLAGEQTPLFFGSAMTNFGVDLFLNAFCDMGTKPKGWIQEEITAKMAAAADEEDAALIIPTEHEEFTGFIFKTQANLDPKHRHRLAYVRVVSGMYEKGMKWVTLDRKLASGINCLRQSRC